jgi:hypothetical protein
VDGLLAGLASRLGLFLKDRSYSIKGLCGNDGRAFHGTPFTFRLRFPFPAARCRDAVKIGAVKPLGTGAAEHPVNIHIRELAPASGTIAFLI